MKPPSTGLATEPDETVGLPLSPELVLVSPELREFALREVRLPYERNGVKPQLDLLDLARDRADDGAERVEAPVEPPFLRAAAVAAVRSAVVAASFIVVVAAAAFGLTIAPPQAEPRLAGPVDGSEPRPPGERAWRSAPEPKAAPPAPAAQGIGSAALHGGAPPAPRSGLGTVHLGDPPLVGNLGALAGESQLRLRKRRTAPVMQRGAVPVTLRGSYISCGRQRWIAAGSNWTLSCERERPNQRR
jgi:hypothetical protein